MAISFITLSEFLQGAEKSSRVSENPSAIEDFCSRLEVLPYGSKAAQPYDAIRAAMERLGQPNGVNDLHIAGHARGEGLALWTNNMSEFVRVPALEVEVTFNLLAGHSHTLNSWKKSFTVDRGVFALAAMVFMALSTCSIERERHRIEILVEVLPRLHQSGDCGAKPCQVRPCPWLWMWLTG